MTIQCKNTFRMSFSHAAHTDALKSSALKHMHDIGSDRSKANLQYFLQPVDDATCSDSDLCTPQVNI